MKILIVYDVSYPHVIGGGQRRLYEVATRLAKSGHEIDWVCFKTWDKLNEAEHAGIKYIGISGFRGLYNKSGSRRKLEPIEFVLSLRSKKINYKKYDIVWSGQWPMLHLIYWYFIPKSFSNSRIVVDWWEIWGKSWLNYSKTLGIFGMYIEKYILNIISKIGHIITISHTGYLKCKHITKSPNISLIHNGISSNQDLNTRTVKNKKYDFVFVGRLKNHKNVDLILHAVKLIKIKHNISLNGVIIGSGPEFSNLRKIITKENLVHQIEFLGALENDIDVMNVVSNSKININPSTKEGGGSITLLESYAAGTPIIIFDHPDGIDKELLFSGSTGYITKKNTAASLAETMLEALNSEDQLNIKSTNAKNISAEFHWDLIAKKYEKLFISLMKKES